LILGVLLGSTLLLCVGVVKLVLPVQLVESCGAEGEESWTLAMAAGICEAKGMGERAGGWSVLGRIDADTNAADGGARWFGTDTKRSVTVGGTEVADTEAAGETGIKGSSVSRRGVKAETHGSACGTRPGSSRIAGGTGGGGCSAAEMVTLLGFLATGTSIFYFCG
jgi:hypothetical protein